MNNSLFSTSRLPADNFLSGSLIGFIASSAISLNQVKDGQIDTKTAMKKVLKISIESGIAAGFGIWASNDVVQGKYINAAIKVAAGLSMIKATNSILKENK
ncbi:Cys/Met metabolism pyridoxal-phosphate-dependent enzyme [Campylobacter fetus]|uniref:Uncharacterized protein n=3 Tax=Campylobacter fetus TaxID=196 RepID=A0AAE6IZF3_CAMFE|nr:MULTISPECIES: hypothetical protein [Campylobacter]OCS23370.1 hypothetical protein CFVI97532_00920 [Campylobacter fetus subsp. venerealis cfvi97/532]OCS26340.1 hypothetical protein CFVB10_04415 [Campylobacter fetus subsp. venerealis cfvB10]OCS30736.1 hypothetical protein CFVCCUG33900_01225 [Campylobacter fetus subsp. venerealis LMG 6570 = CCUG 33900]OCS43014.1 hypothetical protein CFVI02298_01825 [Campylobacter fetus subsp. venerealis cfvi02/298]ABK81761.1 conserved hypothetical protein [Cam